MKRQTRWLRGLVAVSMMACVAPACLAGPTLPATDEQIRERFEAAGESKDYDGASLVYVLDESDVYVQDSGLATTESCQVIKILTEAGIRSQSVLRLPYDPATNRVTVTAIRVHRKDGRIDIIPVASPQVQPTPQGLIFWGELQQVLPLTRLEVGDAIEIRISKIGFNIAYLAEGEGGTTGTSAGETLQPPMPGHWYEVTLFQSNHPILFKRYAVHMPKDKPVQYGVYNGDLRSSLWFHDDYHVYSFWAENIPAVKAEPHMAARDDCVTKVVMATLPDWEMKSRWFHAVNDGQFDANDDIRAKVHELTKDLPTLDAKIAACNHWVADNIRYYGTSRGPCEGFTLHASTETFRDKGGVCKDKAGMLVTMLRVLGIDANPALTMAGSRVEAIPADQFNHTVTVMRDEQGAFRILDPTWIPLSREMWSSRESLQGLVYGTPEGETLTLSPYYPPEHNQLAVRAHSTLETDGSLRTQITMDLKGYACTYLRRNVFKYAKSEQRAAFEETLQIAPNAKIESLDFTDPKDYARDATVDMTVSADDYAVGGDGVHLFRLPLMTNPLSKFFIPDFAYSVEKEKRQYGMRMRATRLVRYEETIKLPTGWAIKHVPEAKTLDSGSASLTFSATAGDGTLTYRFEIALKNQNIPAEDYPGWKEAIDTMNQLANEWVVCTSGSDHHASAHAAQTIDGKEVLHD